MKREIKVLIFSLLAVFFASFFAGGFAQALTLEEYLAQVQSKNKNFRSFEASTSAAEDRFATMDLDLSPALTLKGSYLDDKALVIYGPGIELTRNQVTTYSAELSKKFSSGTTAAVSTGVQGVRTDVTGFGGGAPIETYSGFAEVSLSQSLWKDFFGHATRLRWEREEALRTQEKQSYNLQARQTLIAAESAYWDLIYAQEDIKIREAGLDRAKAILQWVQRRNSNGIGDKADVLNAQGLAQARELELLNAKDDLRTAQQKVADQLEIKNLTELPDLQGNLGQNRSVKSYVNPATAKNRIVRLDAYLAILDAKAKAVAADESQDSLRPDLVVQGSYKTNGYDDDLNGSWSKTTDPGHPTVNVGVEFRWLLDWETKGAARNAAKMDALAATLKKERQLIESDSDWSELLRKNDELSKKIVVAQKISETQTAHAAAERQKLSKGRAITSDVITAEQDADEAALTLTKLKTEQRKLESQGRLYIAIGEGV
jgi:outer membrane protein TolC